MSERTFEEDLQRAIAFHGHMCAGQIIGTRMARIAASLPSMCRWAARAASKYSRAVIATTSTWSSCDYTMGAYRACVMRVRYGHEKSPTGRIPRGSCDQTAYPLPGVTMAPSSGYRNSTSKPSASR